MDPRHAEAVASARTFAARTGAQRVVLLVDRGPESEALMVDCAAGGAVEVTADGRTQALAAGAAVPAAPRPLPELRATPATALSVDPDAGRISAPIGVVRQLADGLLALARTFGGRSVASAEFATSDPDRPILLAARDGEPVVLSAGDREFELPAA